MEGVTAVGIVFVLLAVGAIFLFVARRLLRLALKLAFLLAVVIMLVFGAGIGWWRGWFSPPSSSPSVQRPAATSNQRANTNRRRP